MIPTIPKIAAGAVRSLSSGAAQTAPRPKSSSICRRICANKCSGSELNRLDAILLTHSHADHIHGIDEIRPLVIMAKRKIDLHMDAETAAIVRKNFSYIFETPPGSQYPALLNEHRIITYQTIKLNGLGGSSGGRFLFNLNMAKLDRSVFALVASPIRPTSTQSQRKALPISKGWISGSSTRYATQPTQAISACRKRSAGSRD